MPGSRGRWGRGGRGHSESRVADAPSGPPRPFPASITPEVSANLKVTPAQTLVVGPLVEFLRQRGWAHEQIVYGRREWRIPKNPSEAAKREGSRRFDAYPCDIAIFESVERTNDYRHVRFLIECKQPNQDVGVAELETYLSLERAVLGIWTNSADPEAPAVFMYRNPQGGFITKRGPLRDIPAPGEAIAATTQRLSFRDLTAPTGERLRRLLEGLLDHVVARDNNVTRREDQLDQLCNVLLLKLDSDKQARGTPSEPPMFRPFETPALTADHVRQQFTALADLYPDVFSEDRDRRLRFSDKTLALCVDRLAYLHLLDLGPETVALGFQVLRTAALKQGEGQYFTPQPVIRAAVRLLRVGWQDIVIDPACGTGGFLVEVMLQIGAAHPEHAGELSRWAQTHLFGVDKDSIGIKLTKAIMQILGDGSAHSVRGDSVRTQLWSRDFPHLARPHFSDGRFSVVVTNPPFGKNLTVSAGDARAANLDIARAPDGQYRDLEIGLVFLNRAHQLLKPGGRLGIILPETYFFSRQYHFVFAWLASRFRPTVVANVPMEAFQGFCRAKTNFYVFAKLP